MAPKPDGVAVPNYASGLIDLGVWLERVGVELDGDGVGVTDFFDPNDLPGAPHTVAPPGVELSQQQRELDHLTQLHRGRGLEEDPNLTDVSRDTGAGLEVDRNDNVVSTRPPAVRLVGGPHGRGL